MLKSNSKKIKFFVFIFIFAILINSISFATEEMVVTTSDASSIVVNDDNIVYDDLYVSQKEYTLTTKVLGNVFASVDQFSLDPLSGGGVVSGNLFVKANLVDIKSSIIYSDQKDSDQNSIVKSSSSSLIYGNVYAYCNDFTLETNSTINGDLYIYAKTVNLDKDAKIDGNIFISAETVNFNCQTSGSVYVNTKDFNMGYDGFIYTDLHLNSNISNISGYIFRNSSISSNKITCSDTFKNENNLNIDANIICFAGQVSGNASIRAKNIVFNPDKTCAIKGDLSYSSKKEISLNDNIVTGKTTYTKYSNLSLFGKTLLNKLINLCVLLAYILVLTLLIKKIFPKFIHEFNDFNMKNIFKSLEIGFGVLLITPIIILLLLISRIGIILGFILLALYVILLLLSIPTLFILMLEELKTFISPKYKLLGNDYILMSITVFVFWLLSLIPFVGAIIFILFSVIGFGMLCPLIIKRK